MAFASGLEVVEDAGLLAEVAGLVEWPVVLMGEIDDDFLDLPPEVLQTSMKEHQKFFSVRNPKTGRIERFVTVANCRNRGSRRDHSGGQPKGAVGAAGGCQVLLGKRPARGQRPGMATWIDKLENVTFHNKLGITGRADRPHRRAGARTGPGGGRGCRSGGSRPREVAKADLSSEMVYEFPELQGLMGRYYALEAAGLPEDGRRSLRGTLRAAWPV